MIIAAYLFLGILIIKKNVWKHSLFPQTETIKKNIDKIRKYKSQILKPVRSTCSGPANK